VLPLSAAFCQPFRDAEIILTGGHVRHYLTKWVGFSVPLLVVLTASAADTPGIDQWTSSQLRDYEKSLAPRLSAQKVASETIARYGNHSLLVAHREGSGAAEFHLTQADLLIIQTGEASVLIGGELVGGRSTSATEMVGTSVTGGIEKQLRPGDVVHIPAKTPHQMIVGAGKQITYITVKIDAPVQ
jgi:mannose-6-phosphate isomerase-like protein (cupin superfamily)